MSLTWGTLYVEKMGIGFLALATFDAVVGLVSLFGVDLVVVIVSVPAMVDHLRVHHREQVRDRDLLQTTLYTVLAGSAGDQVHEVEDFLRPPHSFRFLFVQGPEILHVTDVVLHLLQSERTIIIPSNPAAKRIA